MIFMCNSDALPFPTKDVIHEPKVTAALAQDVRLQPEAPTDPAQDESQVPEAPTAPAIDSCNRVAPLSRVEGVSQKLEAETVVPLEDVRKPKLTTPVKDTAGKKSLSATKEKPLKPQAKSRNKTQRNRESGNDNLLIAEKQLTTTSISINKTHTHSETNFNQIN
jgi:hypothetical protein